MERVNRMADIAKVMELEVFLLNYNATNEYLVPNSSDLGIGDGTLNYIHVPKTKAKLQCF